MLSRRTFAKDRISRFDGLQRRRRLAFHIVTISAVVVMVMVAAATPANPAQVNPPTGHLISESLSAQLAAVKAEKASRTPAQRKIDSHLLYAEKKARKVPLPAHFPGMDASIPVAKEGQVVVDVRAQMTTGLLQNVQAAGGRVTSGRPRRTRFGYACH
jgi:hypothetical protein